MSKPAVLQLRALIAADPEKAWDNAWKGAVTPWDCDDVQPALRELFDERWQSTGVSLEDLVDQGRGKALVAGCGKGYDTSFLAEKGFDSLGIDISATAVEVARAFRIAKGPKDTSLKIDFQVQDFFAASPNPLAPASFALAYDYTFLCAIPIELRKPWAARYAEIVHPGGVLVALMFPLDGDRVGGPPYSLSPQLYDELLGEHFTRIYFAKPARCTPGREDKEMMSIWKRK